MLNNFKSTIDNLELAPIDLQGKKFTWCNDQQTPTMTKIDHMFASTEWLEIFLRTDPQALASLGSYHCPLFLQGDCNTPGVYHSLSSGFELKHDRLSGDDNVKVNLWR
jgi:hypothetical protein